MPSNIQLFQGDCLEVMKGIPDQSVDLVLTDPPYGTTACKWDSVIDFDLMWAELKRITKPNSAIVLFGSEPFSSALRMSNVLQYKYDWVWEKSKGSNFQHSKYQPLKVHENVLVFSKSAAAQGSKSPMKYYPQMVAGKEYAGYNNPIGNIGHLSAGNKIPSITIKGSLRHPRSVQYFKTAESEGKFHPTQKPVALMEYLIKTYSNEGDVVLDFTMGSGTTGVAAKNLNRDFIGIEMDEGYFKIAQERIANT